MFKKLKSHHSVPDFSRIKGELAETYPNFYIYTIKDLEYVNNFFKPLINFGIQPANINYIELTDNIAPHTDSLPFVTVVNFIIESANATTTFYSTEDNVTGNNLHPIDPENKRKSNHVKTFNDEQLFETDSYTSDPGDFILLDVSKVHGVELDKQYVRRFVTWRWCISYEKLIKHITVV